MNKYNVQIRYDFHTNTFIHTHTHIHKLKSDHKSVDKLNKWFGVLQLFLGLCNFTVMYKGSHRFDNFHIRSCHKFNKDSF